MSTVQLTDQLTQIQTKLDYITVELDKMQKQREEFNELKKDLTVVAGDIFKTAVHELDEVSHSVNTGDFLKLGKKLLRNTNNISSGLTTLENTVEFLEDLKPIGHDLFHQSVAKLDDLDKKGYFEFIKGIGQITDNIVHHFNAEDMRALADNIVSILEMVKGLTQPQMLSSVENMLTVFRRMDTENIEEYSIWKVIKELNTPEMKRGIGFIMTFLKHIVKEPELKPDRS